MVACANVLGIRVVRAFRQADSGAISFMLGRHTARKELSHTAGELPCGVVGLGGGSTSHRVVGGTEHRRARHRQATPWRFNGTCFCSNPVWNIVNSFSGDAALARRDGARLRGPRRWETTARPSRRRPGPALVRELRLDRGDVRVREAAGLRDFTVAVPGGPWWRWWGPERGGEDDRDRSGARFH